MKRETGCLSTILPSALTTLQAAGSEVSIARQQLTLPCVYASFPSIHIVAVIGGSQRSGAGLFV